MKYAMEEARFECLNYFNNDTLPTDVFLSKYLLRDDENKCLELTPDDLHMRLSREFARIDSEKYHLNFEERYQVYLNAQKRFNRIIAQGSPMAAIGNPYQLMSASNCMVVASPIDSIEGIMTTATEMAQLQKRRAGVGFDISSLRPTNFKVNNAARTTTGAPSFADLFSYVTRKIAQKGRRGALIMTMDVHHPDVEEFATIKTDLKLVTGANISIKLSDEFLEAVESDKLYEQRWPCHGTPTFTRQVSARKVWNTIIETATLTAEPGLLFWNRIKSYLPAESYPQFSSVSCNPCAELNLSAYDSCRLLALNLTSYVKKPFKKNSNFDFASFKSDVHLAMQMLDNLVDLELELVSRIIETAGTQTEKDLWKKFYKAGFDGRRTGLGTLGLADALAQMCLKYDSDEALDFVGQLYEVFRDNAYEASINLAETRGAFPAFNWEMEKNNEFIRNLPERLQKRMAKVGRRNISLLTLPPTGTIALVAQCNNSTLHGISSGIEPLFRIRFKKRKKVNEDEKTLQIDFVDELGDAWHHYDVFHNNIQFYMEETFGKVIDDFDLAQLPDYFVTADRIDWKYRIKMQSVIQNYIDHSISSTVNLPKDTSVDVVGQIYFEAWKAGLKGVTVYVEGSRDGVLLADEQKIDINARPSSIVRMQAPKRPKELLCNIHHLRYKNDRWVAFVGLLDNEPYELFGGHSELLQIPEKCKVGKIVKSHKGKYALHICIDDDDELIIKDIIKAFDNAELAWTTRLISTALRHGTPVDFMVEQLQRDGNLNSFNKVVARVLKNYIPDGQKVKSTAMCIQCQSNDLLWQEGCVTCATCGYTKCS